MGSTNVPQPSLQIHEAGATYLDQKYEMHVLDRLFIALPPRHRVGKFFSWENGLIWGYYTLNRSIFKANLESDLKFRKEDITGLLACHFGKLISQSELSSDGRSIGLFYFLKSKKYENIFFLPEEEFVPYGSHIIMYFGKLLK